MSFVYRNVINQYLAAITLHWPDEIMLESINRFGLLTAVISVDTLSALSQHFSLQSLLRCYK